VGHGNPSRLVPAVPARASGCPEAFSFAVSLTYLARGWFDTFFFAMLEVIRFLKGDAKESGRPLPDSTLSTHPMKGRARTGSLLLLLLLAIAGGLGVQALSAYFEYLALADTVRLVVQDVTLAPQRATEGQERILAKVRELGLPIREDQVILTAEAGKVSARVRWQQPIGFWRFTIPLAFEVKEARSLR